MSEKSTPTKSAEGAAAYFERTKNPRPFTAKGWEDARAAQEAVNLAKAPRKADGTPVAVTFPTFD